MNSGNISDLRDIMQVKDGETAVQPTKKKGRPARPKWQDLGVSRELYALMGDNAPPVTLALPKLKEKPKMQRKVQHWEIRSFTNSARKDTLQLQHWTPKNAPYNENYRFAAFGVGASNVLSYTPDEYNRFLRSDTDWTREETDYLFNMCKHYDLRFIVIHDRWAWPQGPQRTLEDIKERYYGCCKRLVQNRVVTDETQKTSASQYLFDKTREVQRKKYLRSLIQRTPAQIAEEEHLYVESRKLEQTYTRVSRERDDLLRMLSGPGSGATVPTSMSSVQLPAAGLPGQLSAGLKNGLGNSLNRSRRGGRFYEDDAATPPKGKGRGKSHIADPEFDAAHNITRFDPAHVPAINSFGLPKSANTTMGVYLRSTRIPAIKPAMQIKVASVLQELHISQKLVMPTRANQEKLEALMAAVNTVVDLKKQVDRAEYELGVAQARTVPNAKEGDFAVPDDTDSVDRNKRSMSVSTTTSERPHKKRKR